MSLLTGELYHDFKKHVRIKALMLIIIKLALIILDTIKYYHLSNHCGIPLVFIQKKNLKYLEVVG